jgi:hypothetical protein
MLKIRGCPPKETILRGYTASGHPPYETDIELLEARQDFNERDL